MEANPLGETVLAWNERCSKETSEAACVHVDDAHEKSSNPDDHETERSSEWTRDLETIPGSVGAGEQRSISSDADAIAAMSSHGKQRSSLEGVGSSCTAVRGAEFGHNQSSNTGTQPTGFRVVPICQTERDESAGHDALKSVWKGRGKGKRKRKEKSKRKEKARINRRKEHQIRRTGNAPSAWERIVPSP